MLLLQLFSRTYHTRDSDALLKKRNFLNKNTFLYFHKKLKFLKKICICFPCILMLFVFLFFRKISIYFACMFIYFLFFSLERLLHRLFTYCSFLFFFLSNKSISYKHLSVCIIGLIAFFAFIFFKKEKFHSFCMLYLTIFFLSFDNILLSFFYIERKMKKKIKI